MTPQFTTPCYVQVDDPKKRKEVCEKLEEMGYKNIAITDDVWIITQAPNNTTEYLVEYMKIAIDCSTNINLFLALAGMRSNTDVGQWFVCEESYTDPMLDYQFVEAGTLVKQGEFDQYAKAFYRRATPQEIIEHFKTKEK